MNIKPVSSLHAVITTQSNPTAQRNKAIEAFNKGVSSYDKAPAPTTGQAQETAVANPNNVSVEELSAIKPQATDSLDKLATSEDTPAATSDQTLDTKKPDPALQRQFAQLARQERQLRAKVQAQEQAIKAREAALAEKEKAILSKEQQYSEGYISKDQLKQDTLRILSDVGVPTESLYNEMTDQMLGKGLDPRADAAIRRLEAKIASLEAKAQENTKAAEESQQQAYKAAVKQIQLDVNKEVAANPGDYKHIAATNSKKDVTELIEAVYKKDGHLMSVEEACQEVEKYLKDEYQRLKGKLEPAGQQARVEKIAQQMQPQPGMKTLTNAASSTRKLSSRERAMLAFKGELKP
jgi:cell division protein FtsL